MKRFRYIDTGSIILIIFIWITFPITQEMSAETKYEWLSVRVELYQAQKVLGEESGMLLKEAKQFALEEEYDLANIYLEELLSQIEVDTSEWEPDRMRELNGNKTGEFSLSVVGGIDFNHQEFEIGYLQEDSTILEEVKNPYTGLILRYNKEFSTGHSFNIQNALRLDQQNYRNDLYIRWLPADWLNIQFSNYWSEAREFEYNSFVENGLDIRTVTSIFSGIRWIFENNFRYKIFTVDNPYYLDYYRNRLRLGTSGLFWNTDYTYERYENLGGEETDYRQHIVRGSALGNLTPGVYSSLTIDGTIRDYVIKLGDSLAVNRFRQIGFYLSADIKISADLQLGIEENYLFKSYRNKSGFEPDYHLNFLRPALSFKSNRYWEWSLGYEWELKYHLAVPGDVYDVSEQNYDGSGIFGGITYMAPSGAYFVVNLSYQWRRYPNSLSKEIISLYTDRNIFSTMVMGYLPLTQNIFMNVFAIFDDDHDVDFDQQNNQSTIFTLELEYRF